MVGMIPMSRGTGLQMTAHMRHTHATHPTTSTHTSSSTTTSTTGGRGLLHPQRDRDSVAQRRDPRWDGCVEDMCVCACVMAGGSS